MKLSVKSVQCYRVQTCPLSQGRVTPQKMFWPMMRCIEIEERKSTSHSHSVKQITSVVQAKINTSIAALDQ